MDAGRRTTPALSALLVWCVVAAGAVFPAARALAKPAAPRGTDAPATRGSVPAIGMTVAPSLPAKLEPRWDFATAYFPPTSQVVLFGGSPKDFKGTWYSDTWLFDGGNWTQGPAAPSNLKPRGGAAVAYDPDIGKLVLFGGMGADWPPYGDTWLFDGSAWSKGPAAPPTMAGRTGAEMAYDPDIGKVVLFGGSGLLPYNDTWLFDGSKWTKGPASPAGLEARTFFGLTYDAATHQVVMAGGDGATDVWLFDGTAWSAGPPLTSEIGPRERVPLVYDPDLGGDVMACGIGPGSPRSDFYLLRDGAWTQIPTWSGNQDWPEPRVSPGMVWMDSKDALYAFAGIKGAHSGIDAYTDGFYFRDSAPKLTGVTVSPTGPAPGDELTVDFASVSDGYQTLSFKYSWYVDGTKVAGANDHQFIAPSTPGSTVQGKIMVTDALGLTSGWTASNTTTVVNYASINGGSTTPGGTTFISGSGFGDDEVVDVRVDNPTTGLKLLTVTTSGMGNFNGQQVTVPNPFGGGSHVLYGVGRTSGLTGTGTLVVNPTGSINPVNVGAGDLTTYSAVGFVPGETVSVTFPGGTPTTKTADANGSVVVTVASPPEAFPGGELTASAPSGSTTESYNVISRMYDTQTSVPPGQLVPVTLTGYGASETVSFTIDGTQVSTGTTDAGGSLSANVPMNGYFGANRKFEATGLSSGESNFVNITLTSSVKLSPSKGPVGLLVTITSGPGWIPGEKVHVYWMSSKVADVTADASGKISYLYVIPTHSPGSVNIKLTDDTLGVQPVAPFQVT